MQRTGRDGTSDAGHLPAARGTRPGAAARRSARSTRPACPARRAAGQPAMARWPRVQASSRTSRASRALRVAQAATPRAGVRPAVSRIPARSSRRCRQEARRYRRGMCGGPCSRPSPASRSRSTVQRAFQVGAAGQPGAQQPRRDRQVDAGQLQRPGGGDRVGGLAAGPGEGVHDLPGGADPACRRPRGPGPFPAVTAAAAAAVTHWWPASAVIAWPRRRSSRGRAGRSSPRRRR